MDSVWKGEGKRPVKRTNFGRPKVTYFRSEIESSGSNGSARDRNTRYFRDFSRYSPKTKRTCPTKIETPTAAGRGHAETRPPRKSPKLERASFAPTRSF